MSRHSAPRTRRPGSSAEHGRGLEDNRSTVGRRTNPVPSSTDAQSGFSRQQIIAITIDCHSLCLLCGWQMASHSPGRE
ncbi:hypothetical protein M407DRAFT_160477 [Tulasnella calospora MUT 4182]|uniref:Uncharacterized protein n=1 Tax=Tulasnella calospora MUT 4182 TaxID=1051891 RepID=A0A0C3Q4S2_9AGAM|nr:hypothetical protein M407DRAFT_164003 [Tulasnella calospora MUT 4182]KIO18331.1 hypothetical protein M407DRAFT_160477 [Tulasnella calospora MUT 4182]